MTNEISIKWETVLDAMAATVATTNTNADTTEPSEGLYEVEDSSADNGAPLTNARVLLDGTTDANCPADVTRGTQGCATTGVHGFCTMVTPRTAHTMAVTTLETLCTTRCHSRRHTFFTVAHQTRHARKT